MLGHTGFLWRKQDLGNDCRNANFDASLREKIHKFVCVKRVCLRCLRRACVQANKRRTDPLRFFAKGIGAKPHQPSRQGGRINFCHCQYLNLWRFVWRHPRKCLAFWLACWRGASTVCRPTNYRSPKSSVSLAICAKMHSRARADRYSVEPAGASESTDGGSVSAQINRSAIGSILPRRDEIPPTGSAQARATRFCSRGLFCRRRVLNWTGMPIWKLATNSGTIAGGYSRRNQEFAWHKPARLVGNKGDQYLGRFRGDGYRTVRGELVGAIGKSCAWVVRQSKGCRKRSYWNIQHRQRHCHAVRTDVEDHASQSIGRHGAERLAVDRRRVDQLHQGGTLRAYAESPGVGDVKRDVDQAAAGSRRDRRRDIKFDGDLTGGRIDNGRNLPAGSWTGNRAQGDVLGCQAQGASDRMPKSAWLRPNRCCRLERDYRG